MSEENPPFAKGDRIEMIEMGVDPHSGKADPDPISPGAQGSVEYCMWFVSWNQWQVIVKWDNGRSLSLMIPPDRAKKI
jgi:hypothetical protein